MSLHHLYSERRWLPRESHGRAPLGDATDPRNWRTRSEIRGSAGFVFRDCEFSCVDIDGKPPYDPLGVWSIELVNLAAGGTTYVETSLSGLGVHVIGRSHLPPVDVHSSGGRLHVKRMLGFVALTETGDGDPTLEITPALEHLHGLLRAPLLPHRLPRTDSLGVATATDEQIVTVLVETHDTFRELFAGRWQDRYSSQSEADLAFCALLAPWFDFDRERIDHVVRASGLMREKWNRRDYRERTLLLACTEPV